uniref:sugar-phospahte nucleotidyltransferase n=1 Tax=Lachnoclostridium phocaeense TaxID=1871021 RepID=UPI0026DD46FE|nr:sugar-phospahte nucleotidyltransferase [Lachnoclostridium phocaeense]
MNQFQFSFQKQDEYWTPRYAVVPIIDYLKPDSRIWCPFDSEKSQYVNTFVDHGFHVVYGHIDDGHDFFTEKVPDCDYIISNPPYSLKLPVFKRLYEIGKPFAMLINFQGLFDSNERFDLFKKHEVQIMFLRPRVNYIVNGIEQKGAPFQSVYICDRILDQQIVFKRISRQD